MVKENSITKRVTAMLLSTVMLLSGYTFLPTTKADATLTNNDKAVTVCYKGTGIYWQNSVSFSFHTNGDPDKPRESHTIPQGRERSVMRANSVNSGDVLYCIAPGVDLDEQESTNINSSFWNNLIKSQQQAIAFAAYYGYPQNKGNVKTNVVNQEVATQLIIWEIICGYRNSTAPFSYNSNASSPDRFIKGICGNSYSQNTGVKTEYDAIVLAMKHHTDIMSFAKHKDGQAKANPYTLTWDGSKYLWSGTDSKGVLSGFKFNNQSGLTFTKSGNKLTVTATSPVSSPVNY